MKINWNKNKNNPFKFENICKNSLFYRIVPLPGYREFSEGPLIHIYTNFAGQSNFGCLLLTIE